MSASTDSKTKPNTPTPTSENISFLLELFKYRNIAWRYLLCYCLPLQQKILIKQLRIAHDRTSSLSAQRKQSVETQKKSNKSKNIFNNISSLFDDSDEQKYMHNSDENDDDIPDFYHLPRISLNELQTLFKEGRQKYELLTKIYITEKQQAIRNEMMRATAPPSEQYNDPSLRTRSHTITQLIQREDSKCTKIFTRIDLIKDDWKAQEKMNKLVQLRSAPPTYSPPKPPPFISQPQHRHNFHANKKKNARTRSNTISGDTLNIKSKLNIGKKKKKKKNASDIFKMKVFQSKSHSVGNSQPIKKLLNLRHSTMSGPTVTKEMSELHRGRTKRRFSEITSKKKPTSQSPFAALSNPGKYGKKKKKRVPQTPPPRKNALLSLSYISAIANKSKSLTPQFLPKTKPLTPKHKKTKKTRSRSPLNLLLGGRKKQIKTEKKLNNSLKNPSLSLETEDIDIVLREQAEYYSDDEINSFNKHEKLLFLPANRSLSLSQIERFKPKRRRSFSEDDIKYTYIKNRNSEKTDNADTKSVTNLNLNNDNFDENLLPELARNPISRPDCKQKQTEKLEFSGNGNKLNMLPDEDENDEYVLKELEFDIGAFKEMDLDIDIATEANETESTIINVIEDDDDSDETGTLLNATMIDYDENVMSDEDTMDINARNTAETETESLVVAAPLHKDKDGTIIVSEPAGSAPPIQHDIMMANNNKQRSFHCSLSQINRNGLLNGEFDAVQTDWNEAAISDSLGNLEKQLESEGDEKTKRRNSMENETETDVFDNNGSTKPGLFSDGESDEYGNMNGNASSKQSNSSMDRSFGEIVVSHPLAEEANVGVSAAETTSCHDMDIENKRRRKRSKRGQRPNTMISGFTPHFLANIHNICEIEEKENKALWKQIMKDVNRTFQYRDFFRKKETRYSLGNLLYIWSRINHKIGYLQGMHDLASIITMAIYFDYKIYNVDEDNEDNATLQELLDPKYLEHDIYCIYSALLQLTVKFFEQAVAPEKEPENAEEDKEEEEDNKSHLNRGLFDSGSNCSLYLKLHYLHHKLLKHFDLTLYTHFEAIGLSPQLYMLRWIRVLFSREFYLDQILQLWDELFVSENLIEFIDYIVMAMINNVRNDLLLTSDMTIIAILQNYPKKGSDIAALASIARDIQLGEIRFDFVSSNKELYSDIKSVEKMRDYYQESMWLFNKDINDYESFPPPAATATANTQIANETDHNYYHFLNGADIRIPGFGEITPTQKYLVKKIIDNHYGRNIDAMHRKYIRMGYLVKRGSGDQSIFARRNLKIRWFVIDENQKMCYYKNKKAYLKKEEALRTPIKLKGRAIRVVQSKYFCFEISGINVSKRAYLLFAKDFTDFVLWLHTLMWCADKSLYEAI